MKKFLVFLCAMFLFFGIAGTASATLIDRGGGLIYDDDLGISPGVTWLQDANYAATELTDARRDEIIAAVVEVAGHTLTASDFLKSGNNYTGKMTWWGAMAWADQLVYQGYSDWRLPSAMNVNVDPPTGPDCGYNVTGSEMGHVYYTELGNTGGGFTNSGLFGDTLQPDFYWSGTEYAPFSYSAWGFYFYRGDQYNDYKGDFYYAWAVRPGDSAPIPEPATLLLMGSGLAGLGAIRKRRGHTASRT